MIRARVSRAQSTWILFVLCLLLFGLPVRQAKASFLSELGAQARYDQRASYWFSADDDDGDEEMGNALDYEPELIPTQVFQGSILFQNSRVFTYDYESPLDNEDASQDDMLEISDKDSAMKKMSLALNLYALFKGNENPYLGFLRAMRFDYKKHYFFGKAEAQEPTTYVASNGSETVLEPGDEIRFKTDFEEISLTWGSEMIHVGIYRAKTKKPHETSILDENNVVMETEIMGTGLKLIVDTENFLVDLNLGLVEFKGTGGLKSDGGELLFHTEWRPHIYLIGGPDSSSRYRLALIPSIGVQFNMQLADEFKGVESDGSGETSMDIIVDAAFGVMLQF